MTIFTDRLKEQRKKTTSLKKSWLTFWECRKVLTLTGKMVKESPALKILLS